MTSPETTYTHTHANTHKHTDTQDGVTLTSGTFMKLWKTFFLRLVNVDFRVTIVEQKPTTTRSDVYLLKGKLVHSVD